MHVIPFHALFAEDGVSPNPELADEPIIVQRYSRQDVALVPLWEWRFFKQMEANIRAGKPPWEEQDDGQQ